MAKEYVEQVAAKLGEIYSVAPEFARTGATDGLRIM